MVKHSKNVSKKDFMAAAARKNLSKSESKALYKCYGKLGKLVPHESNYNKKIRSLKSRSGGKSRRRRSGRKSRKSRRHRSGRKSRKSRKSRRRRSGRKSRAKHHKSRKSRRRRSGRKSRAKHHKSRKSRRYRYDDGFGAKDWTTAAYREATSRDSKQKLSCGRTGKATFWTPAPKTTEEQCREKTVTLKPGGGKINVCRWAQNECNQLSPAQIRKYNPNYKE